jgi:hypothetical protein
MVLLSAPAPLPQALSLAPFRLSQGDAPFLAIGYKVAVLFGIAQYPIAGDFFAEPLQEAGKRFAISLFNSGQTSSPPFQTSVDGAEPIRSASWQHKIGTLPKM